MACWRDTRTQRLFDDRQEREVTCELLQKNVGTNVQSATRVHEPEACEGCLPSAIGDRAMGGEVEGDGFPSSEKVRRSRIYGVCRRCWRFAQRM